MTSQIDSLDLGYSALLRASCASLHDLPPGMVEEESRVQVQVQVEVQVQVRGRQLSPFPPSRPAYM